MAGQGRVLLGLVVCIDGDIGAFIDGKKIRLSICITTASLGREEEECEY